MHLRACQAALKVIPQDFLRQGYTMDETSPSACDALDDAGYEILSKKLPARKPAAAAAQPKAAAAEAAAKPSAAAAAAGAAAGGLRAPMAAPAVTEEYSSLRGEREMLVSCRLK